MKLWIHYHPSTGQIIGWENGSEPYVRPGYEVVHISPSSDDGWSPPNHKTQKVDILTKQLVKMTAAEVAEANAPTALEVKGAISGELYASDAMLVPDRPLSKESRAAWERYRQALRDLSKPQDENERRLTPSEVVAAWPNRPDGVDPIVFLRERI